MRRLCDGDPKFPSTILWLAMLLGFIVAVFWVIITLVFIRGYNRWVHGDEIKQIEDDEDRDAVRGLLDDAE
jgi:hypothetical protein